ncbi:hypothetical protein PIROE2DRAFT_61622 [Piromyces sp. E2]|nr:hypothetical protein PIROE2DRAFT_61622 [Piromyces sp. E2]|eukprot:OUM62834.1 hypothetical protein PIROE2DRAFT_61622 [Piromyces sp. E2]
MGITLKLEIFESNLPDYVLESEVLTESLLEKNKLINKYYKRPPKTWNEFYDTGKYILEEEEKINNNELYGYVALYSDNEIGMCSIYEYIYSNRLSKDDPFPNITSPNITKALEMLKTIKNDISSDKLFRFSIDEINSLSQNGNVLFFTSYFGCSSNPKYVASPLPGSSEGISASSLVGFNVGINFHLNYEKTKAAIEVTKFITSKEVQKKIVMEKGLLSGIYSLFDEKDDLPNLVQKMKSNVN